MKTIRKITRGLAKIAGCFLLLIPLTGFNLPRTDILFHELAVQKNQRKNPDKDFNLPFNAYVIGVEKANKSEIGKIEECKSKQQNNHCLNIDVDYYAGDHSFNEEVRDIYSGQHRPTFVSHIAKFSTTSTSTPCFLYNIYDQSGLCQGITNVIPERKQYISKSWNVLSELGQDISNDIQTTKPTHFIVYIMGWNTPQWKAMKNYQDLFGNLTKAAENKPSYDFRPIFLGITWPSMGSTVPGADYGIRAKDADEVGMIWGNILVNRVLADLKAKYDIPIVVVGHSFGARATSRAVFSSPLISSDSLPQKNVDLLLGLQGAYSYQRYIKGAGEEGSPYRDFSKMVGKAVLTSSEHDTAVTQMFHEDVFVGSNKTYKKTEVSSLFEHIKIDDKGLMPLPISCDSSKIAYIDASSVIKKGDGNSGAHSDIYNPEIGRLTFDFISSCVKPVGFNHQN